MSRLIVKNLPDKVNKERLRDVFSEKGEVTDVQLLFTPQGKFRKFAFVGFKTPQQAVEALNHLDNTYFNSSKIKVELCTDLVSTESPRPWSKYSKRKQPEVDNKLITTDKKGEKNKNSRIEENILCKVKSLKDDVAFHEFLEIHSSEKVLDVLNGEEDEDLDCENPETESQLIKDEKNAAYSAITDQEYLKLKTKGDITNIVHSDGEDNSNIRHKLYTVKVKNLPKGIKKHEIRELFKPCVTASIRKAKGLLGIVYVGFRTDKEMRRALIKNRSFVKGKKLVVNECREKETQVALPEKWKLQQDTLKQEETVAESGRIFLRNLCYSVREEEIESLFSQYGPLTEVNLPVDKLTRKGKGYGTVTFVFPEHAVAAYTILDGTIFQGRMLHLLPGQPKQQHQLESTDFKKIKYTHLKKTSGHSYNWNTLFLGRNAVADVVAETYKAPKQYVLTGGEAAVRLALGETQLVASTKQFLVEQGICLDMFDREVNQRSRNVILVKNLPANTIGQEIREKFQKFGNVGRVVLPPNGIMAVVEFEEPSEARSAFTNLAYSKFKNLPLFLEWAPENTFNTTTTAQPSNNANSPCDDQPEQNPMSENTSDDETEPEPDSTLYIKNLSFKTTEDNLKDHFSKCGRVATVTVATKRDSKNPGKSLSLGYGFVQFYLRSALNKALCELQGSQLDGHVLELKRSDRTARVLTVSNKKLVNVNRQTGAKILVRNVPFQADLVEIKKLFETFGHLKNVRMPKKMAGTGNHRGFCFVEFMTKHEAKVAMKALSQSTHLYGRRLVLEWAAPEDLQVDAIRKRTAKHFSADPDAAGSNSKNKAFADLDDQIHAEDSDYEL